MGVHGVPAQGMECLATMEDITSETYVDAEVVTQLQEAQFPAFMKGVQEPDCKAELRRLLAKGPPIWVEDKYGFPLPDNGDTHVVALWFSSTNEEKSAKLHGAVEGDEREKLWSELKELLQAMEDDKEEVRD
ncbi:hypothetical protein AaE_003888 [Aphanomyces astaci]|uniref:Uncharacterized protein n=1 Tax=Aphanomyces astaci TaxID=112090 RepID=A0A6A5ATZ1_APHAT|nr:hypothetical protein AaE_003888 [Aphanomyces astaci]